MKTTTCTGNSNELCGLRVQYAYYEHWTDCQYDTLRYHTIGYYQTYLYGSVNAKIVAIMDMHLLI